MIVKQFPDRKTTINKTKFLYFGGTSYLSIATHKKFQKQLFKSIKKWGAFYGSSRNSNIKLAIYNKFETFFAKQIGAKDALVVSSGTIAGRLTVDYLATKITSFYHYPKTHPSILGINSKPLFVDGKLHPNLLNSTVEEIVITADAVLALEVSPTSFGFLNNISEVKKITLLIDESHSLGIVGKNGKGIFNSISDVKIHRKIMVSSLGKGLGLSGGIIVSDVNFINKIKSETLFVSASGANPAYLDAYLKNVKIYEQQRQKLKANLALFHSKLQSTNQLFFDKNYPVIYSKDVAIYQKLKENGIIITNFKYPNYKDKMSRIVLTANHKKKDLKKLASVLNNVFFEKETKV